MIREIFAKIRDFDIDLEIHGITSFVSESFTETSLMAELRLNSEIIGNFRNFEKFLGPLVEHQN